jgi:glycosyltransferase involved in cell wall biosynthesis
MAYRHIQVFKKTNVIACSKTIQTLLNRHGINSSAVQNGINFDDYCPVDHHKKDNLRKKLGINDNEFVFISVGSLIPRKDMQTIIEAFNNTRHIKKVKLIILGNGYLSSYLQSGVKNDLVLFPGNVSNVVEYLQAADVFVSSSLSEGLPNTVLEAMACGLPCLLSDIPSHKEIIGETEWLFLCKDHIKLASLMETIGGMDTCHLGSQSRQKAEKNFNAQKMSELYQDFYRNIQKMPGK